MQKANHCQQVPIRPLKNLSKEVTFEDSEEELDVIESEPDSVSSEEEKAAEASEQRANKIRNTKVGLTEFLQTLDYRFLGLFFKSILAYFLLCFCMCLLYLFFTYHLNKPMWHEYFPVEDKDEL